MSSAPVHSADHAAHRRRVALGIAAAIAGAATLSVNDLAIKMLSGGYPLHEVILTRAFIAFLFILGFIPASGQSYRLLLTRRPKMHLLRASIVMVSNVTYFLGLAALPIANAQAIGFASPLIMTVLSVVILHERVGPHRWGAVIVGLVGVLIMLRPEGGGVVHPAAVLVLISAFCYASTQIMTRTMKDTESAVTINFYTQIGFLLVSATMGLWVGDGHLAGSSDASLAFLFRAWTWPPLADLPYFLMTGLAVAAGGMLMSQAYRMNETALVAPFEYSSMPLGIIWGLVFFGTFPDLQGWIGIVLIIGAGLYTLWRETVRRRGRVY
jgi:drug/metabolite transporter (DMT)-like permease